MGIDPWLDEDELRGGREWEPAIREALRSCSHFIALISHASVQKTGFVQREMRQALELLEYRPPGDVFVIPVRLDHAEPRHERLRRLHWIDLFRDYAAGMRSLGRSLGVDAERLEALMAMLERRPPLLTSIRKFRVMSKMSLAELADQMGISEDHLAAIEAARVRVVPSEAQLSQVARALNAGYIEVRTPDDESSGEPTFPQVSGLTRR
jgi:ribosome-binding protein aMBF1 (putative translation factor)